MSFFKAKGGSGFQLIPEGKEVLLRVKEVDYDVDFFTETTANIDVTFETESGITSKQKYNLAHEIGSVVFTLLVKFAFNDFTINEGDDIQEYADNLEGKYITADIEHIESQTINPKTEKPYVNLRLSNMAVTDLTFVNDTGKTIIEETGEVVEDTGADFEF